MHVQKFEDLIVWQKAKELNILIHTCMKHNNDFIFKNQIQRAALSVINNIAEGFDRQSTKEYKQFLHIAKGSCSEVRSMLLLGLEYKYFDVNQFTQAYNLSQEISKMLFKMIMLLTNKLNSPSTPGP
ncbi:MAG: four helix bundle protein [Patescibacteria group bacterium]